MKTKTSLFIFSLLFILCSFALASCGDSSPSHTHEWGAWTQTKAATCTAAGEETRVCALDASHKETRALAINPQAHDWSAWTQTKAPTETEEGEETRTCTLDATHKETRPIPMLTHEHQWGEWQVTKAPTTTEEGEETRTCTLDATHKETRSIPKLTIQRDYTITLLGKTVTVTDSRTGANDQTLEQMGVMAKLRDGAAFLDSSIPNTDSASVEAINRVLAKGMIIIVEKPAVPYSNTTGTRVKNDGKTMFFDIDYITGPDVANNNISGRIRNAILNYLDKGLELTNAAPLNPLRIASLSATYFPLSTFNFPI